ncbi:hypothetical protein GUITHDRAFT_115971 [Guillardia theta CCMP2712]|uniref:Uncharacterized protein n=1 Tax=Guillardia theta (strain CCMP2712) TaxID=905079 RepID=L1INH9_GUITC|nr:hypothetical protein GUITHDRAFT_115971 [Guillardia theta CCMP2712]EKX37831.1 hypothetical protein GUITHDRAFT_115971 [Guillardia theta CCMP2712]|eukprot:XP_005824811.1 hypothetical protein GUITHDRAFT_115971 [Guillardia theta CCMP2712]
MVIASTVKRSPAAELTAYSTADRCSNDIRRETKEARLLRSNEDKELTHGDMETYKQLINTFTQTLTARFIERDNELARNNRPCKKPTDLIRSINSIVDSIKLQRKV